VSTAIPDRIRAIVASAEVGTAAGSAAWLAFQHGWRWNDGTPPAPCSPSPTSAESASRCSATETLQKSDDSQLQVIITPVEETLKVLDDRFLDLRAAGRGGFMIFGGASGAGKSTFLKHGQGSSVKGSRPRGHPVRPGPRDVEARAEAGRQHKGGVRQAHRDRAPERRPAERRHWPWTGRLRARLGPRDGEVARRTDLNFKSDLYCLHGGLPLRLEMMWRARTGRADIANYVLGKINNYGRAIGLLR